VTPPLFTFLTSVSPNLQVARAILEHPDLVQRVKGVFHFCVKNCGDWVVNLKTPPGGVRMVCRWWWEREGYCSCAVAVQLLLQGDLEVAGHRKGHGACIEVGSVLLSFVPSPC
jgi:hypothetical protein